MVISIRFGSKVQNIYDVDSAIAIDIKSKAPLYQIKQPSYIVQMWKLHEQMKNATWKDFESYVRKLKKAISINKLETASEKDKELFSKGFQKDFRLYQVKSSSLLVFIKGLFDDLVNLEVGIFLEQIKTKSSIISTYKRAFKQFQKENTIKPKNNLKAFDILGIVGDKGILNIQSVETELKELIKSKSKEYKVKRTPYLQSLWTLFTKFRNQDVAVFVKYVEKQKAKLNENNSLLSEATADSFINGFKSQVKILPFEQRDLLMFIQGLFTELETQTIDKFLESATKKRKAYFYFIEKRKALLDLFN